MSTAAPDGRLQVLDDPDAVAQWTADFLLQRALAASGPFTVALSGGSTPKRLYEVLAGGDHARRFPWDRVRLCFGDERMVPPDHDDSNYAMANAALLSKVPVPPEHVFRMPTDGDPAEAAARYGRDLRGLYGADRLEPGRPLFDVVLLGLGENGHTASLFPDTPVLDEEVAWVGTCEPHDAPHARLTLTYPAIGSSAAVLFLVAGSGKASVVRAVRGGDASLPAARVRCEGELVWVLDRAAAGDDGSGGQGSEHG